GALIVPDGYNESHGVVLHRSHPHNALVASRAPSTRLMNFAHTISGSISGRSFGLSVDAKPQSELAITRSRPTSLARRRMRSATSSGCSTITDAWVMQPGIRTLPSGSLTFSHTRHSCSWRGLDISNE